jgi:hypothetical protein
VNDKRLVTQEDGLEFWQSKEPVAVLGSSERQHTASGNMAELRPEELAQSQFRTPQLCQPLQVASRNTASRYMTLKSRV